MSTVKPGYGYGDYGYVQRKPLINYHSQKAPASVSTVVTEISGVNLNEKPPYNGAGAVQKKLAFLEKEDAGVYSGYHGGTMQTAYQHGSEVGGYDTLRHDGAEVVAYALHNRAETGGGVQTQRAPYGKTYMHQIAGAGSQQGGSGALAHQHKQEQESEDESEKSGDESDSEEEEKEEEEEEEELAYGQHGTGGAQRYGEYKQEGKHDSVVQKHGYGEHQQGGDAGEYGDVRGDSTIQKHGYGGKKAYQHTGGYEAVLHDSTVQKKYGYGEQKAYQGDVGEHGGVVQAVHSQQRCLMPYLLIWWPMGRRRW